MPSQLLGLTNSYTAWCFNNAVYYFGQSLESELNDIDSKSVNWRGQQAMILMRWLPDSKQQLFRNPSETRKER